MVTDALTTPEDREQHAAQYKSCTVTSIHTQVFIGPHLLSRNSFKFAFTCNR